MSFDINGYDLSRAWFDWCFENPEKIKPNHSAMYFFIIEHCNRLGWKEKFGLPMEMTKDAIGISNYRTYSKTFDDLVSWGFIKVFQKSTNQYSATVIGLVKNTKATTKALSKATQKHSQKQSIGIVGIDKPINLLTKEPINNNLEIFETLKFELFNSQVWISDCERTLKTNNIKMYLTDFLADLFLKEDYFKSLVEVKSHFVNWVKLQLKKKHVFEPDKITSTTKPKPFPHER